MRWRWSFRTKLALAFFLVGAGGSVLVMTTTFRRARAAQLEGLRDLLLTQAAVAAPEVDGDRLARRAAPTDAAKDETLDRLRALGARILASNPKFREVYAIAVDPSTGAGRIAYDSDPADEGKPYDVRRVPAMRRALAAPGAPAADDDLVEDAYGVTLSGYAPIRDGAGRTVGLLGIDVDGSTVRAMRRELWALLAGGTVAALVLGALLAWLVSARISRPVAALSDGVDRVAHGDLHTRVDPALPDEFGVLASHFNAMVEGLEERERIKQALHVASEIQQSLFPDAPPDVPGLDVSGTSDYCDETGGDYYDWPRILPLPRGRVAFAVGDVTGHGIGAALLMASGRAVLRSRAESDTPPGELLGFVNRHLVQDTAAGKFMTLFYGVLDAAGGTIVYANAGQGGCFVYRAAEGRFEDMPATAPPLAVIDGMQVPERRVEGLRPGDLVVLGTDGIWEAQDPDRELFEMDRYREAVRANASRTALEVQKAVMDAVVAYRRGAPQTDDITLIVAKLGPRA
jgi:serine phosphatase RsbU (regulator of sigma subunit)